MKSKFHQECDDGNILAWLLLSFERVHPADNASLICPTRAAPHSFANLLGKKRVSQRMGSVRCLSYFILLPRFQFGKSWCVPDFLCLN
jgi:hypothetical protein